MSTRSSARSRAQRAPASGASPRRRSAAWFWRGFSRRFSFPRELALGLALALGCGDASLDERPADSGDASTSTGDTLPPLGTDGSSSGEASTGEPPAMPDDPRLCPVECAVVLPPTWVYEATPPPRPGTPGSHVVPAMLRDADGSLTVAELASGEPRLHHLDDEGRLQWNVPLPLPCDPCELTDVARHPSGDLLLSASGLDSHGELVLLASRYDAVRHAPVWTSDLPLQPISGVHVRSGGIAALSDQVVAQLYMRGEIEFDILQRTLVVAYGPDGALLDEEYLVLGSATTTRPPLLARTTADGALLVGVFGGSSSQVYGLTNRISPPLWHTGGFAFPPAALDDVVLDARDHALELGHTFDGENAYLLLSDRVGVDALPRWVAGLALPSTSASTAALALGSDGDVYAALRVTQAPGGTAEPLVALALARWSPDGELRWHTTLLQAVAESFHPLALAVDDDEGLVVAAVVNERLRVERRAQGCACGE